ncbi:hypothetical protein BDB00DRAFT_635407 [Zychaea mexicana]|uniref:uncharacterized protein n=1 Tax=Zychaea mexicana TaxID=64656 RepID=UPI0022FDCDFD|nr:uncharacterized protein BDB00DRAFT_635407 [Zychaea mexicana]KAI9489145.1 hypothetical protein BDB00DRAFT_635407 [Zychaea mexicana]
MIKGGLLSHNVVVVVVVAVVALGHNNDRSLFYRTLCFALPFSIKKIKIELYLQFVTQNGTSGLGKREFPGRLKRREGGLLQIIELKKIRQNGLSEICCSISL